VELTYSCGTVKTKRWRPDNVSEEECEYKQHLKANLNETCERCQEQENANRDAAFMRITRAHAAEEHTVQELRAQIQELDGDAIDVEALIQEGDELAEMLEVLEGPAIEELMEIFLDDQRQSEDTNNRIDILAVEQNTFMRQVDEENAAIDMAILDLRERLQIALLEQHKQQQELETAMVEQQPKGVGGFSGGEPGATKTLEDIRAQLEILLVQSRTLIEEKERLERSMDKRRELEADDLVAGLVAIQKALTADEAEDSNQPSSGKKLEGESRDQNRKSITTTEDRHNSEEQKSVVAIIEVPKHKPQKPFKPPKPTKPSSSLIVGTHSASGEPATVQKEGKLGRRP
jgi:hypothetical protein